MKVIQVIGPDGVGKSTICSQLTDQLSMNSYKSRSVWLRFNNYISKIFNAICRLFGKSYYEQYTWGKLGYHDYQGSLGNLYIILVFLDHIIFHTFVRRSKIRTDVDFNVIDRYVFDTVVDLYVDTNNIRLPLVLFSSFIKKELRESLVYCLKCDYDIVVSRRSDIADDKVYSKKLEGYKIIRRLYGITSIDTGVNEVMESVNLIKKECI
ncbi:hypothetical protein BIT28_19050 [Photobacterium proteolyticum]|uniref:Thymidylate kinase-like domain-containing protein n=1 Tax=Photobacterium proteolyticum TaxID=1903952 RepID=A0A1Q9GN85_9GAMM|nr:hypothetical protein [Photobacterium proteolyticum]OLQ76113.1 hypothetical protein BIT28_19050 [Photobacterium proteolyticum]